MKRASSTNSLDGLSDAELHQKMLQYGLPNVPVTETTRGLLINRLKNHMKNEKFKRKQNRDTKGTEKNNRLNSSILSYDSSPQCSPSNTLNSSYLRSSPRMYAPPPILASDSTEDLRRSSYMNVDRVPTYSNGSPNGHLGQIWPNTQYGMVGRLLSFRDSTIKKASLSGQGSPVHERKRRMHAPPPILASDKTLVCAFFVFFIAIALIYVFMSPDHSKTIREIGTRSVVCDTNVYQKENSTQLQDCIKKENLASTLNLNKKLLGFLQDRAKQHHCVNKSTPAAISFSEFLGSDSQSQTELEDVKRSSFSILKDMEHLITNNPQWKIGITDTNGQPLSITTLSEQNAQNALFVLFKPSLPLTCVFLNKLTQFFAIVGTGAVIAALIALCYFLFKYVKRHQQIRADATERFVSKIIHELLESSRKGTGEIVVNHLRDTLVPINERKALLKPWAEALKLIESNDSRIHFAVKNVNGEDVKTIRWVGGGMAEKFNNIDCSNTFMTTKSKWQSPAFDNRNQIVPPTPCLKIRHMFDAADVNNPNLKQLIHSAIVEKVGKNCNILDVQLDKQTFCVYVRCATEEDAGLIHNEINGWWFDKRLVSIKFLRLERYFSRFPKMQTMLNSC